MPSLINLLLLLPLLLLETRTRLEVRMLRMKKAKKPRKRRRRRRGHIIRKSRSLIHFLRTLRLNLAVEVLPMEVVGAEGAAEVEGAEGTKRGKRMSQPLANLVVLG